MNTTDAFALAAGFLIWLPVLVVLLRWPGRTIGVASALLLWALIGHWGFWATLSATAVGALVRRRCGADRQVPVRRGGPVALEITHPQAARSGRRITSRLAPQLEAA